MPAFSLAGTKAVVCNLAWSIFSYWDTVSSFPSHLQPQDVLIRTLPLLDTQHWPHYTTSSVNNEVPTIFGILLNHNRSNRPPVVQYLKNSQKRIEIEAHLLLRYVLLSFLEGLDNWELEQQSEGYVESPVPMVISYGITNYNQVTTFLSYKSIWL